MPIEANALAAWYAGLFPGQELAARIAAELGKAPEAVVHYPADNIIMVTRDDAGRPWASVGQFAELVLGGDIPADEATRAKIANGSLTDADVAARTPQWAYAEPLSGEDLERFARLLGYDPS